MKGMTGTKATRTRRPPLDSWEVDDAARTIARAAEIKADKRMMAAVKKNEMKRRKDMDKALKSK